MRAIVVNEPGAPDVLRLEEVETPQPGPGEVLIELTVAGVNFADVGMRAGIIGGTHALELPYTPGFEAAGVVAAAELGIGGVPFYIVDGRYAVSGGQPTEVWLRTLDAIEAERVS